MTHTILYAAGTDRGRVRDTNEDAFFTKTIWDGKYLLMLVVDGCGGYEGGEIASEIARSVIPGFLDVHSEGVRMESLKQAVLMANNTICDARELDGRYSAMGCVLTSVILDKENDLMLIAHVGDTRCYVFDGQELRKITRDHSMVGELEDEGLITEAEAMNHPSRAIIDRMVGEGRHTLQDQFVDATIYPLPPYYQILLCSDGLTDCVTAAEIKSVLSRKTTVEDKTRCLIELSINKGGEDNVTVVLAEKQFKD